MLFLTALLISCATPNGMISELQPLPEMPKTYIDPGPANIREIEATSILIKSSLGGRGSGVVIKTGSNYSYVLTAGHVFHKTAKIEVYTISGLRIKGCLWVDHISTPDLGVLYVPYRLKAIQIASSMPLKGSRIYTSGNKLGGGFWPSDGIYGGIVDPRGKHQYSGKFARGSIPTHPGNSGGAVVYDCKLVGIVSKILVFKQKSLPGQILPTTLMFVPVTQIHLYLDRIQSKMNGQVPKRQ